MEIVEKGKKVLNLTNRLIGTKEMLHLFSYNGIIIRRIRRKEEEEKEEEAEQNNKNNPLQVLQEGGVLHIYKLPNTLNTQNNYHSYICQCHIWIVPIVKTI